MPRTIPRTALPDRPAPTVVEDGSMPATLRKSSARHDRLIRALEGARKVAVLTHDNPDPDAIAAGWGIVTLIERVLRVPAHIYAGGDITRAENRVFVDLLQPPLDLVDHFEIEEGTEIVVVDTQFPGLLNAHPDLTTCAAVIDHHAHEASRARPSQKAASPSASKEPNRSNGAKSNGAKSNGAKSNGSKSNGAKSSPAKTVSGKASAAKPSRPILRYRFRDVRPKVVASASMVAGYLRAFEIEPDGPLATALLYGIHTDATGWDVKYSGADRQAVAWLAQYSDPELRGQIERAPIPRSYFEDLILALQNTFTYEDAAVCFLPSCASVEVVSEVADLLLRCEGVRRVLCGGHKGGRMIFSARTSRNGGSAAWLLARTLRREGGSSGGHTHRAGGYLVSSTCAGSQQEVESRLRTRWLNACSITQQRGTRLVAKKEILKALD